ncbi:MAG: hypothetical protein LBF92_05290 [Synergistaceae bacterium]|jgi:hypothetical protein|nr:hypothetical protein [Synergistaceae bacterium]
MKLQKIIILLLALFLMRWDMSVANSETTQPPSDESDATAETVSYSTFLGEWEASEGKARVRGGSLPLKISESSLKIDASYNDKVMIDFKVYYEDKNNKKWFSNRHVRHEVERSALQGSLPKTIKWQETHKLTRNGIASNMLYFYTVEFKDKDTISVRVFDKAADSTAVFKRKK